MTVTVSNWEDPNSWNQFVASVRGTHFQQSWEWGELAPDLGGRVVRLAASRNGAITGAMQVFINPLSTTGRTHLYVPRGPAISRPDIQLLGPLLDAAAALGRAERAVGIRMEPNVQAGDVCWRASLSALGLHPTFPPSQPRSSWLLDISSDEETLLGQMKQKTRYNIRLASRKGVEVREGSEADMGAFFALYRETADRDDFFIQPRDLYERMFQLFRNAGNFRMLLAEYKGQVIAAVTLIRFGGTCWYMHGASSNLHRNLMATYLLQWEAIKQAKCWGCTLYDFRAVPDVLREDQDMFGVFRFKEGFGGCHYTTMHTYAASYAPFLFALWQAAFRLRFDMTNRRRRAHGLSIRQFA